MFDNKPTGKILQFPGAGKPNSNQQLPKELKDYGDGHGNGSDHSEDIPRSVFEQLVKLYNQERDEAAKLGKENEQLRYRMRADDDAAMGLCLTEEQKRLEADQRGRGLEVRVTELEDRLAEKKTEVQELNGQIKTLYAKANVDDLTELLTRGAYEKEFGRELDRAQRTGKHISILFIDGDYFKNVNDTYGHHVGDIVLEGIAGKLKDNTRQYDILGRYGGEEFVVVLPETDKEQATTIAERIRQDIEHAEFSEENKLKVTASIGITTYDPNTHYRDLPVNLETIRKNMTQVADKALYQAKHNGRNQVQYISLENGHIANNQQ